MDKEKKNAIEDAKSFCEGMETENKLRKTIADITAKLSCSNLSPDEGKRQAKSLVKAYRRLKKFK